ncbi:MAG: hypothetical protein SNJ54_11605 [Anaerolineae bacterium]
MQFRRRNTAWLAALGMLIGLALLATGGTLSAPVQIALIAIFAVAMIASLVNFGANNRILESLRTSPVRSRMTLEAREAESRARARGLYYRGGATMLDVGLIAIQSSEDGMSMRRTSEVSKDDDGVRPFITLFVQPKDAERNVAVRFEIYDQHGTPKFLFETRKFLRAGEMTIMSDNYLPLAGNREIEGVGDWESRVYVDGNLMSVQPMTMLPSISERSSRLHRPSRLADDADVVFDIMDEEKQPRSPTLQDLLSSGGAEDNDIEAAIRRRNATSRRRR